MGDPWRRVLRWSVWILTIGLVSAGILLVIIETGVVEGPGAPPGAPDDLPTRIGYFFADERERFPYEIAAGVLFSAGFLAFAAIGVALRSAFARRDSTGTVIATSFVASAVLLTISQLMYLGAKEVAIDPAICQCPFAPEQLIAQQRALDMVGGAANWIGAGALLLAGLGMFSIPIITARSGAVSASWALTSRALAVVFLIAVVATIAELDTLFQITAAVGSVFLLPAWAVWLERQLRSTDDGPTGAARTET